MDKKEIVEILKSITVKDTGEHYKDESGFNRAEKIGEALSYAIDIIEHLDHDSISRKDEWINVNDLRLMRVDECAGHTIEYAQGWKACIEWLKSGGDRKEFQQ